MAEMTIAEAQRDMQRAYVSGGPGAFVSGLVWLAAAAVFINAGANTGFATLFFGGMSIFPLSKLACSTLFRRANEARGNVLGRTAIESTIPMIAGLGAAWLFLRVHPVWAFPFAAIAIGVRYFTFRTVYGDLRFWLMGGAIALIGVSGLIAGGLSPVGVMLAVGLTEIGVGTVLTVQDRTTTSPVVDSGGTA